MCTSRDVTGLADEALDNPVEAVALRTCSPQNELITALICLTLMRYFIVDAH